MRSIGAESFSLREAPVWPDPGRIIYKPANVVELLNESGNPIVINAELDWLVSWLVEISERAPRW